MTWKMPVCPIHMCEMGYVEDRGGEFIKCRVRGCWVSCPLDGVLRGSSVFLAGADREAVVQKIEEDYQVALARNEERRAARERAEDEWSARCGKRYT